LATPDCDIAVVGAGPYGLAAAAHLHAANGQSIRVFGKPMSFWEWQMPRGMLLRSPYVASNIADPDQALTLDGYQADTNELLAPPVPLEQFVRYGHWFQQQAAPDLDTRGVADIQNNGVFRLNLDDGDQLTARRVVVAAGIMPFAWTPSQFRDLPPELTSHTVDSFASTAGEAAAAGRGVERFAGKRVVVIGGGQSALESAALLHEAGAEVRVLVRAPRIYYLRRARGLIHSLGPVTDLLFAPAEVGPAGVSRLVSMPSWYRRLPRPLQDRFSVRSLRPAGAAWLQPRLRDVAMSFSTNVVAATEAPEGVSMLLNTGEYVTCDHVLLATGYRVDISRYRFLGSRLLQRISMVGGYPSLDRGFESSLPGLHFVGAPAAWSYGPLMRFVAGTEFAAPVLARAITRKR
jgi:FAD-dependent urate hydroxylase